MIWKNSFDESQHLSYTFCLDLLQNIGYNLVYRKGLLIEIQSCQNFLHYKVYIWEKIKNKTDRTATVYLKTAIIEKEWIKRLKKFILEGPKYLLPLVEGIDARSEIIFVTEPEKLLHILASLINWATFSFGRQL